MTKRMINMLIVVGLILAAVFGYKMFGSYMMGRYMKALASAPQVVATMHATTQEWQPQIRAVGSLRAVQGADLSVETSGIVESIDFTSGEDIKAGAELLHLRAADDIAKLHALEASAHLAALTYDRDKKQFAAQAVSQATLDFDAATLDSANAAVTEQQAVIEKKVVRAPFAGRLGIRAVDVGQYVGAGTAVVSLQTVDPIYLDFPLPQQEVSRLKTGLTVTVQTDAYPDRRFTGEVSALNSRVDTASRNVQVRATIKNPNHALLPGMYGTVAIDSGVVNRYITLPQTAVTYNPYGNIVYVVEHQGNDEKGQPRLIAQQAFVTLGPARGDQVAIVNGLKEGDEVIVLGQLKLRNGSPIMINNAVMPSNDAAPALPSDQ
ncbi:MAG: efflux RND transporter periplasmic adaptor subunit [Rhodospirillaceae bacterium]|nr:MAG: efflux RND transporter periplasmic adaptor subunit [Rhodospirillaceae bacterium]